MFTIADGIAVNPKRQFDSTQHSDAGVDNTATSSYHRTLIPFSIIPIPRTEFHLTAPPPLLKHNTRIRRTKRALLQRPPRSQRQRLLRRLSPTPRDLPTRSSKHLLVQTRARQACESAGDLVPVFAEAGDLYADA